MHAQRVAYFSAGYPRVTDAFITREMAGVVAAGLEVERFAVRAPGDDTMTGPVQERERELTTYLLGRSKASYLNELVRALRRSPKRFVDTLRLAKETRRVGVEGTLRQLAYVVEAAVLANELIDGGFDHLHNHFADSSCTVAMLASELSGVPFSFTIHGPAIFFEAGEWSLGHKVERARFVAAISAYARAQLSIYSAAEHWDKIHIIHCGIEPPANVAPRTERDDETLELLFIGRLEPVKGIAVLLEAMAKVTANGVPARLTIAGDGSIRSELEATAKRLGLDETVRFVGYRSQEQLAEHLAETDALVMASFNEGVPVSLMEAMSHARAVVATSVGGVTELVKDGDNGRVVRPGEPDDLADAIAALAQDRQQAVAMGDAGRAFVCAEFDSATEAKRLASLFRDAESLRGTLRVEPTA